MKKTVSIIMVLLILSSTASFGAPLDFSGGVQDEHIYEEIVFISGEPIKFAGKYTVSHKSKKDIESVSYKFNLESEDPAYEGKLSRTVTYDTDITHHDGTGQKLGQTNVSKYKENIKIKDDSYYLTDFQFSKSDVVDGMPAAEYNAGNIKGRKYYEINSGEGTVVVDISGGNVGYENFWGSTETQIVDSYIDYKVKDENETPEGGRPPEGEEVKKSWQGTVSHQVSDSLTKSLRYSENDANISSFHGGHIKMTNRSIVSNYSYELPTGRGSKTLNKSMVPKVERLIVPKFRDVNGHWAEDNIKKLYSLDVFDENTSRFAPDAYMNRMDFTKAVIKASDIRPTMEDVNTSKRSRKKEVVEESPFRDVSSKSEDYGYVKSGLDKRIVSGISEREFGPDRPLTRSEAITILVRALGLEHRAPNPGYITSFSDDYLIPNWAKDSVYIGREMNLISGDSNNNFNPNEKLTRAEASTMIIRFLEFLEKDLQKDYRDNIIRFN